jgi:FkbM family methyltransferase
MIDAFCTAEMKRIIEEDSYKIRPMIGHGVKYVVDIGGNYGGFTIAASRAFPDAEIIVVEPDPAIMDVLMVNTRECAARIHPIQAACMGVVTGTVQFVRLPGSGGSYVKGTGWEAQTDEEGETFSVLAFTLPDLLTRFSFPRIDILKIDAEGVEGQILLSLKRAGWLEKTRWIRGEWHGRDDWPRIEEALRDTHIYALQDSERNGELIAHRREA